MKLLWAVTLVTSIPALAMASEQASDKQENQDQDMNDPRYRSRCQRGIQ